MSSSENLATGSGRGGGRGKLAGRQRGAELPSPPGLASPETRTPRQPPPEPRPAPSTRPTPNEVSTAPEKTTAKSPPPKPKPKPRKQAKARIEPLGAVKGRKREVLLRLLPENVTRLKERTAIDPNSTLGIATIDVVAEHVNELRSAPATVERPGGAPPRRRARRYHAGGRTQISVLLETDEATWLAQLVADTGRSVSDLVDEALARETRRG